MASLLPPWVLSLLSSPSPPLHTASHQRSTDLRPKTPFEPPDVFLCCEMFELAGWFNRLLYFRFINQEDGPSEEGRNPPVIYLCSLSPLFTSSLLSLLPRHLPLSFHYFCCTASSSSYIPCQVGPAAVELQRRQSGFVVSFQRQEHGSLTCTSVWECCHLNRKRSLVCLTMSERFLMDLSLKCVHVKYAISNMWQNKECLFTASVSISSQ